MIKKFCIFLLFSSVLGSGHSQTYSKLVSDNEIELIISSEIQQLPISAYELRNAPDKIEQDIADWQQIFEIDINAFHLIQDVFDYEFEDTLKGITDLFTEADFKYFKFQIEQQIERKWQLSRSTIKAVRNCKRECSRFSIPLFNIDHTLAIIYEEEIYNPISACGMIKVYLLKDTKWKEYKSIMIWLM